jgi:hypothetical protein
MAHEKKMIQTLNYEYQDFLNPDVFQNIMTKLVQDVQYAKTIMLC